MPALKRGATRLLRIVKGKEHATNDDHVESLPTPPATRSPLVLPSVISDEDLTRSPESSEDESTVSGPPTNNATFKAPRQVDGGAEEESHRVSTFRRPGVNSPNGAGSKRHADHDAPKSDDDDALLFGPERKKQKPSSFSNIHAPRRKEKGYGSRSQRTPQKSSQTATFKRPQRGDAKDGQDKPKLPQFKKAVGIDTDMFEFGEDHSAPLFKSSGDIVDLRDEAETRHSPSSPSLSSLSSAMDSPEVQEIESFNLPAPRPYAPKIECQICNETVDLALQEEFEMLFTKGAHFVDYKWQQRFCRWHKQHDVKKRRAEMKYPDIDWEGLDRRMRRFHRHLKDVVYGRAESVYRQQLNERVRDGSKTTLKALAAKDGEKRETSVGYYGPRGERLM